MLIKKNLVYSIQMKVSNTVRMGKHHLGKSSAGTLIPLVLIH